MYSHVRAIEVSLWGRHVGTIAPKTATHYRFEYDDAFLRSGTEIAPFELPLEKREFSFLDRPASAFYGLPAVFADSLPDSFGNSDNDRCFVFHSVCQSRKTGTRLKKWSANMELRFSGE